MEGHDAITRRRASRTNARSFASPIERVLEALDGAACRPRRSASGWHARCPAHDDQRPSLSIGIGRRGCVLIRCWAGCETPTILDALGLTWRDLFNDSPEPRGRA